MTAVAKARAKMVEAVEFYAASGCVEARQLRIQLVDEVLDALITAAKAEERVRQSAPPSPVSTP